MNGVIKIKKLFISQPMKGKTDEEIFEERKRAISNVLGIVSSVEIIDSYIHEDIPAGANALWYLGKSLEKLAEVDIAYFAKGWREYRGCRIEHMCAKEYDIDVVIEDNSV